MSNEGIRWYENIGYLISSALQKYCAKKGDESDKCQSTVPKSVIAGNTSALESELRKESPEFAQRGQFVAFKNLDGDRFELRCKENKGLYDCLLGVWQKSFGGEGGFGFLWGCSGHETLEPTVAFEHAWWTSHTCGRRIDINDVCTKLEDGMNKLYLYNTEAYICPGSYESSLHVEGEDFVLNVNDVFFKGGYLTFSGSNNFKVCLDETTFDGNGNVLYDAGVISLIKTDNAVLKMGSVTGRNYPNSAAITLGDRSDVSAAKLFVSGMSPYGAVSDLSRYVPPAEDKIFHDSKIISDGDQLCMRLGGSDTVVKNVECEGFRDGIESWWGNTEFENVDLIGTNPPSNNCNLYDINNICENHHGTGIYIENSGKKFIVMLKNLNITNYKTGIHIEPRDSPPKSIDVSNSYIGYNCYGIYVKGLGLYNEFTNNTMDGNCFGVSLMKCDDNYSEWQQNEFLIYNGPCIFYAADDCPVNKDIAKVNPAWTID